MAAKKTISEILQEIDTELDSQTIKVIKILEKKSSVSENVIADKIREKINTARKLLYRLAGKGLVTYEKRRDPKKKWWYLYYWSLDKDKIMGAYYNFKKKELERLQKEFEAEQQHAFECRPCDIRFTYEAALEADFSCPHCGSVLVQIDPSRLSQKLRRQISEIERELAGPAKKK